MEKILIVEDEFIVANDLEMMLIKAGHQVCGIADSVIEANKFLETMRPSFVLLDIFLQDGSYGIDLAARLNNESIGFIYISANTNQSVLEEAKASHPHGFLVKPFREKDLLIMLDIARGKQQQSQEISLLRERSFESLANKLLNEKNDTSSLIEGLPVVLQELIPFEYLKLDFRAAKGLKGQQYNFLKKGLNQYEVLTEVALHKLIGFEGGSKFDGFNVAPETEGSVLNGLAYKRELLDNVWEKHLSTYLRLESSLTIPVINEHGAIAVFRLYSSNHEEYNQNNLWLLNKHKQTLQRFLSHLQDAIKHNLVPSNDKLIGIKLSNSVSQFHGIVGNSPLLTKVLENVKMVAPTSVSVIILGESGTGKEQIAKLIHNLSNRKSKSLVTVNCAAIPHALIESELFGHEKGAFTGAVDRRIGKFEQANGGTIFLDEIGELPLESQVKLLRVLQECEFERVGGSKTLRSDVRILAATNRNLEKEVAEGRFRLDLYYRLNVLTINLPPLRERTQDIASLTAHFLEKVSKTFNKTGLSVNPKALRTLMNYHWPGNIRELEHLIERTVLLTSGSEIDQFIFPAVAIAKVETVDQSPLNSHRTLAEVEATYIIEVIRHCGGKIEGPGGAAEILGLPPSTLKSKLQRLGIKRGFHYDF